LIPVKSCCICDEEVTLKASDEDFRLFHCSSCGHYSCWHKELKLPENYDVQDAGAEFLESLAATRIRQGARIVEEVLKKESNPSVLDYGCGRGFFLQACQRRNVKPLLGADLSQLAVDAVRKMGVEALLLDKETSSLNALTKIQPSVVSFLDVIEHLTLDEIAATFQQLKTSFPDSLKSWVIKVPVCSGILFRASLLFFRLGFKNPLKQLLQVGTDPPHRHYFSKGSLSLLMRRFGLEPSKSWGEPDFEAASFSKRLRFKNSAASLAGLFVGHFLHFAAVGLGAEDSCVTIFSLRGLQ